MDAALRDVMRRYYSDLDKLEQDATYFGSNAAEIRRDEIASANIRARAMVLGPLAARGVAEAMVRLSDNGLRESDDPADVEQWFKLISCAADLGHPLALDELVRWYWHQRGDGSIRQVQDNRKRALVFANRAALAGNLFAITRIATYIAGDVHQYPADLGLARRLLVLCGRTGNRQCEEWLAGEWTYDPGLSATDAYIWLSRAADVEPARFAKKRDIAGAKLTSEERLRATRSAEIWRPTPWRDLQPEWHSIEANIVTHGETSTGLLLACGTQSPWCRTVEVSGAPEAGP